MTSLQSNLNHLQSLLDTDEQKEFMDTIQDEVGDLMSELDAANDENKVLDETNNELRSFISEMSENGDGFCEINCGIGTIEYLTYNILLSQIMEALEEKLKTTSPNDIVNLLERG